MILQTSRKKLAFALVATVLSTNAAYAVDRAVSTFPEPRVVGNSSELKPHIGLRLGVSNPQGDMNSGVGYGIEYGYQPYIPVGVAVELSALTTDSQNPTDVNRAKLLLKGTYNFGGTVPIVRNSYVGVGAGPVLDTAADGVSRARFGVAPLAGFDIPIATAGTSDVKNVSLGANAHYLFVSHDAPNSFELAGMMKYWF